MSRVCYYNQNGEMICQRRTRCNKCIDDLKFDYTFNKLGQHEMKYIYGHGFPCLQGSACPYANGCEYTNLNWRNKYNYGDQRYPANAFKNYISDNTYLTGYKHQFGNLNMCSGR